MNKTMIRWKTNTKISKKAALLHCDKHTKQQRRFRRYIVGRSTEGEQQVAGIDGGAGCHGDGSDAAGLGGDNLVLHLHGLDDHDDLTGSNGITGILAQTQNGAGQGGGNIGSAASSRSGSG